MAFSNTFRAALTVAALLGSVSFVQAQVTFNRVTAGEPETMDPHKTSTTTEANVMRDLFENLLIHDVDGKAVAGTAETWTISPDGKVYTFKLRKNAKWSNGDPVTAEDFVFSYRRMLDPKTGAKYSSILFPILNAEAFNGGKDGKTAEDLGVKALDANTLEITLARPTPYFLELLTHQTSSPLHRKSLEQFGNDFVKPGNLVSNGPYMLAENVPNSHVRLKKNPHFHAADTVKVDVVNHKPATDLAAATRSFMAGEIDLMEDIPADQIKFLKEKLGKQVQITPYLGTYFILLQTKKEPMTNPKVRRALSMVIDREFLAEQVWQNTMLPAYAIIPPGVSNYVENPPQLDYKDKSPIDRETEAKKLLAEAGYGPSGKKLTIEYRYNTTDNHKNTAIAIADNWKQIGVDTTFVNTDAKTHFAFLRDNRDYQVARYGWIGDYADPQNFLFLLESKNKGLNAANFEDAEFDRLMTASENETDLKKRAELLAKAEKIGNDGHGWVPLMFYTNKWLVSPKFTGIVPNLRGAAATRYIAPAK